MLLKRNLFIFISLLLATAPALAQQKDSAAQEQKNSIDQIILDTKANLKDYAKVEKISGTDRYKYAYYKDKELKVISVMQAENGIKKKVSWYYDKGNYIYCEQHWTYIDSQKVMSDHKFYLNNGHLIYWLNTENLPVLDDSPEFAELDKDLGAVGLKMKNTL